jgi:tetratricopeptide (TPR) repeat protein
MTFRTLAAPVALVALLASLWGCAGKTAPSEPVEQNPLAAGNAAFDQKDYARACQELSRAGGGAATQAKAGTACARDGEAKANRAFTAALSADPRYAPALEGLGLAAYAAGDLSRARDLLEASAKAGGTDPQAALVLGQVYLLTGQCSPALAAFQEAARRDPTQAGAKARLDVAKLLCGASRGGQSSAGPAASHAAPGLSGVPAGPTPGTAPAPGAKETPKGKPAARTIDLNDI